MKLACKQPTLDNEERRRDDVTDDVGRHTLVDALVSDVQVPDGQVAGVQYRPRARQNAVHLHASIKLVRLSSIVKIHIDFET